ncbi:transglutaminase-like cysteine peptidase [Bradyrhizobium vignae]|uniref:transglutaminase-like cysteine peptidase n=1 Tax=Bradyrhizobium vignae TaxID=1549949 RepID=UPI00100C1C60|nr:transglutaminase-like cysteine peptidase [Bradyrhizobium vignae]RXG88293.1 hypothetical protein EAV90_31150 [Bradyrhizobium vignae]
MIRYAASTLAIIYWICGQPAYCGFEQQVAAPLSFALFCVRYPEDCQQHGDLRITDFRSRSQRWRELNQINSMVNFSIMPKALAASRNDYDWQIFPSEGNCADYAVTKRHLLLRAGWPSSSLLLAEVGIRTTGEHHLVLLVREGRAILVIDNLSTAILNVNEASDQYAFLRIQSNHDPQLWTRRLTVS